MNQYETGLKLISYASYEQHVLAGNNCSLSRNSQFFVIQWEAKISAWDFYLQEKF